ncbi:MAG: cyclic pyranopterin monophosphate synthase MoaC [Rhizobacter sp.]|nr:cyclic pyranopterin monophosphate synthase MoaC [Bacteriovorax sp.]
MFTHVDDKNLPTMVDVTEKMTSHRVARAQSLVQLPSEFREHLKGDELYLKKGPVFQTAIIAGTMAVKKTHEIIPFCHQIPVESCKFKITINEHLLVTIGCEVKTTFKTGVEMEALHGAMSAALTVYDMCKAISHNIVIGETKLMTKTGGKRTVLDRPIYGIVLTGGKSKRMEKDKALINYKGKPHAQHIYDLLTPHCDEVYLSTTKDQWKGTTLDTLPAIYDFEENLGPIGGILSAFKKHPEANWFVVACDLIHFNEKTIETLLSNYQTDKVATAFRNAEKGFPEPLCTLYTPAALNVFMNAIQNDMACPVKILKNASVNLIDQSAGINLANINTVQEFNEVQHEIN